MFRWGVLSTAKIGRDQVIPAIVDAENGVLSAIASRDIKKGAGAGRALRRAACLRLLRGAARLRHGRRRLYSAADVAACRMGAKAAEAGKHVLVEKPLALDAKDIAPLIKLRNRKKVLVSEAFMVIYHPQWQKVRELVRSARSAACVMCRAPSPITTSTRPNMRNQLSLGGGALPDIGVYPTRLDPLCHRQGAGARAGDDRARQEIRHRYLFVDQRRFRRFRTVVLSVRRRWPTGS